MEIILTIIGLITGLTGTIVGVFSFLQEEKKRKLTIEISLEDGKKIKIEANTPAGDVEKLIHKLQFAIDTNAKYNMTEKSHCNIIKNESGFILSELFLYLVPGVIAILFSITFIYLIIKNQGISDYAIPKELNSAMTMIIGYFFGVGAASATNKGKVLTSEDIKNIIQSKDQA